MKGQGDEEFGQWDQGPRDDDRPLWGGPGARELGCHRRLSLSSLGWTLCQPCGREETPPSLKGSFNTSE